MVFSSLSPTRDKALLDKAHVFLNEEKKRKGIKKEKKAEDWQKTMAGPAMALFLLLWRLYPSLPLWQTPSPMLMPMLENCLSQPQAQITSLSGQQSIGEMYEYVHHRRKVPTETHPELVPKQDDRKRGRDHTQVNHTAREPPESQLFCFPRPIRRPGVLHLRSGLLLPLN